MATDIRWKVAGKRGGQSTPFHEFVQIALANAANGTEVVPALRNLVPHVMGYTIASTAGAMDIYLVHTAGVVGTQISAQIQHAAAASTHVPLSVPLSGVAAQNIGILGSAAATAEAEIWGYYADR